MAQTSLLRPCARCLGKNLEVSVSLHRTNRTYATSSSSPSTSTIDPDDFFQPPTDSRNDYSADADAPSGRDRGIAPRGQSEDRSSSRTMSDMERKAREIVERRRQSSELMSDLEKLGSTQNRSTTFRPHHALHRPLPTSSLTLSHLVASGAHLGHSTTLSHPASFPLIYGTRAGISVIDLRQTLTYLRRAAEVVRGVVERDGLVVFLGTTKGTEKAIMKNAQRLGRNGYGTLKWLPGTITNASKIFEKVPLYDSTASESVAEEQDSSRRPTSTTAASFMPSLLVLLSPRTTAHALREANLANIPTIGIVDTDVDPRAVTYPIPANDDSPRTVELIAGVLGLAGQDGLERQRERRQQYEDFRRERRRQGLEGQRRA